METRNITAFLVRWLMLSAVLIYTADSIPLTAYTSQHFNGLPPSIPSFVYYRDPQPQNQQKLFFSPINTPYNQYLASNNLRESVQQLPLPSAVRLGILNSGLRPQSQGAYEIREENRFPSGGNGFALPTANGIGIPPINNAGFLVQRNNGFATSVGNNFAAPNRVLQSLAQPGPPLSHQISLLRYASGFTRPGTHQDEFDKALMSLSPTFQQRQRSVATAGELVYRQQRAGAKPFLSSDSEGVQREGGGEELSSHGGFLGQPYRRPTFVSAVGTPVSGVGQNPLYTGDSVQASKLDEASDVKGVKNPGGIPAPGRLPISHDIHLARPFTRYANSFGYSLREEPPFGPVVPSLAEGRAPFILPPGDYRRGVINR